MSPRLAALYNRSAAPSISNTTNTKMITTVKTSFGSVTSFYRVGMEIHDYGFHYFLKWVMDLAYGSDTENE